MPMVVMEPSKERREKILDIVSKIRQEDKQERISQRRKCDAPKGAEAEGVLPSY